MNSVIEFPQNRVSSSSRKESGVTAEVVIFPGVRIDRSGLRASDPFEIPLKRRAAPSGGSDVETE